MFVRVKPSSNGLHQKVQLVESLREGTKVRQRIVRHIGTAHSEKELEHFIRLAHHVKAQMEEDRTPTLFGPEKMAELSLIHTSAPEPTRPAIQVKDLVEESRSVVGIHDVYGQIYKELAFDRLLPQPKRHQADTDYLRHLTMARIATPSSKRKAVDLLEHSFGVSLDLDRVYRLMDKLDDTFIEKLQTLSLQGVQQTLALFQEEIDILFYDATTLYFESFTEDELKQNGYSKDCKFNQAQVLLCLFVTRQGLPVGYELFPGSTYEGHTLLLALEKLKQRFQVRHLVFVADSGLLNEPNLSLLEQAGYTYIVGARLKSLPQKVQDQVTDKARYEELNEDVRTQAITLEDEDRAKGRKARYLIVSHSETRARKDAHDRLKAIQKMQEKLKKSKNPTSLISNYGYKKYIRIEGEAEVIIDEEKLAAGAKWDGFHGVVTNAESLSHEEVLAHYKGLWQVEETFRVSKSDLKIRPIYHWTPERIRAHIAMCYMALCCVRQLEYRVNRLYQKLSPEVIRENLMSVQASILRHKPSGQKYVLPSTTREHAGKIYQVMGLKLVTQPTAL